MIRKSCTYHLLYALPEVLVENFSCHLKYCLNILTRLSRCLEEKGDIVLLLKCSCFRDLNFPMLLTILHVSYKNLDYIWFTLLINFCMPSLQTLESTPSSDVVGQEYTVRPLVKYLRNRLERLLASSIPNLQLE